MIAISFGIHVQRVVVCARLDLESLEKSKRLTDSPARRHIGRSLCAWHHQPDKNRPRSRRRLCLASASGGLEKVTARLQLSCRAPTSESALVDAAPCPMLSIEEITVTGMATIRFEPCMSATRVPTTCRYFAWHVIESDSMSRLRR